MDQLNFFNNISSAEFDRCALKAHHSKLYYPTPIRDAFAFKMSARENVPSEMPPIAIS